MAIYQEEINFTLEAFLDSAWVDISADVLAGSFRFRDGMATNHPLDRLANVGEATFTLVDTTGKYMPGHSAVLSGWGIGAKLRLTISFDGADYQYFFYVATPNGIKLASKSRLQSPYVQITAYDWLDYASRTPFDNPGLLENKTGDEVIDEVLAIIPVDPAGTSLDTGKDTFPLTFDTVTSHGKAYSEFAKVALSELGYIYLDTEEVLTFENARHRSGHDAPTAFATPAGIELEEDGGFELREDGSLELRDTTGTESLDADNSFISLDVTHGSGLINRLTDYAYPRRLDIEPQVLYRLSEPIKIPAGGSITVKGNYTNPDGSGLPVRADSTKMTTPEEGGATDTYRKTLLHFDSETFVSGTQYTTPDATGNHTWTLQNNSMLVDDVYTDGFGTLRISGNILGRFAIFGGVSPYYLTAPSSSDFEFGSGAFTIGWFEARVNVVASQSTMARDGTSTYPPFLLGKLDTSDNLMKIYMSSNGSSWDIANGVSMGKVKASRWVWYEVSRDEDGWFYAFAGGQLVSKWYSALSFPANSNPFSIGRTQNTQYAYFGFDEFFVDKGRCLHKTDFIPPEKELLTVLTGDYLANTADDNTGTDMTSDLTVTPTWGTEGFTYEISSAATVPIYLTYLTIRGRGIYQENPIERVIKNDTSINEYGANSETLHQKYQVTLDTGPERAAHIVALNSKPELQINRAEFIANVSQPMMQAFLNVGIGDMIRLQSDTHESDLYYYIQGRDWQILPGKIIKFNWLLQPRYNLEKGLSLLTTVCENTDQALDFGDFPEAQSMDAMTISAWIYVFAIGGNNKTIISSFSDYSGWIFRVNSSGYLSVYYLGTGFGSWEALSAALSPGQWYHVAMTRDNALAANNAKLYIDGVSQTVTSSNYTARLDESKNRLILGNINTPTYPYSRPFNGKISGVRIYPSVLSDAQILALYNAGRNDVSTELTGAVFQGPAIRTNRIPDYIGALSDDDRAVDNIYYTVGNPKNEPVGAYSPEFAGTRSTVSFDATTSDTAANAASLTFSHTVGSGTDRMLIVGISKRAYNYVTSVTYGGQAMSRYYSGRYAADNYPQFELWYLPSPPVGTASVVVTLPANDWFEVNAISFFGVDQNDPIRNVKITTGTGTTPSLTIAGESTDIVYDLLAIEKGGGTTLTADAGQTQRMNASSDGNWAGASSTEPGAASVTTGWTISVSSKNWIYTSMAIQGSIP